MPGHNYAYNPILPMDNSTDSGAGGGGLPSTHSSQHLMPPDTDSITARSDRIHGVPDAQINGNGGRFGFSSVSGMQWFTIGVLCFVNLINYMDRFTIAGVLTSIQSDFHLRDDSAGLLQTVFVIFYMIFAPIFGYLGDRYSRKWIMAAGIFIWSTTTVLGSFMTNYGWFVTFRALVGIGEASYSTIAPTIISDLFIDNLRSKMLALFYFAIPVGSGLGYIIGSETAHLAGSWRWALRVTPFLGALAVVLIFFIREPNRGESEGSSHLQMTSFTTDLKELSKNRSFILSTAGFTCVTFVAGALAFWGPKFVHLGLKSQPGNEHLSINEVSFKFGAIAMVSGIIGVPLGSYLSQTLKKRIPTIDPILCGAGLLLSVPLLAGAMILVTKNEIAAYILVFFGEVTLNMNWAIVADILLYVVIPTRRSTAEAIQILASHAFGDAGSPYLVGVISEAIKPKLREAYSGFKSVFAINGIESLALTLENNSTLLSKTTEATADILKEDTIQVQFQALQYALFSTCFIEVIGGILFLVTTIYLIRDKNRATQIVRDFRQEASEESTLSTSSIDLTLHPRT